MSIRSSSVLAVCAGLWAAPASAVTAITFGAADIGTTYTISFNGQVGTNPTVIYPALGATAQIRLLGIDAASKVFSFAFAIDNISAASTGSRVSVFGFDVTDPVTTPVASGFTANSIFDRTGSGVIASLGTREVCFRAGGGGNGCAGGGGGGVGITGGYSSGQLFKLAFPTSSLTVTLDHFGIKYQSISGIAGVPSAEGTGFISDSATPEPASWVSMIAGFGLIGTIARRRRTRSAT